MVTTNSNRKRSFFLEPDELHIEASVVQVVDNSGDEDNIIYGQIALDGRDQFEGHAVSAEWETEQQGNGTWATNVNDYDKFQRLEQLELKCQTADDIIDTYTAKMEEAVVELDARREELKGLFRMYGSYPQDMVMEGMRLRDRIEDMKQIFEEWVARRTYLQADIRSMEADDVEDPDVVLDNAEYNLCHWNLVYKSGEHMVQSLGRKMAKLDNYGLTVMLGQVQKKRQRKELSFRHYVHLCGAINGELYRRCGARNFSLRRNQMADLWKKYQLGSRCNPLAPAPDTEVLYDPAERQYGETRLTETELVSAIDSRSQAQTVAAHYGIQMDEALELVSPSQ